MHNMNILLINCPSALGIYSTMQQQRKCILTWDRYSDHLREAFKEMMTSSEFADVTLVTDDKQQINAHRNILSACSPVFKNILKLNSGYNNPVIYLRGIQHLEMESIIKFIYLGEARISEEKLADFLTVSKNLEIEELSTVTVIKDQNAFKSEIDDHYATDERMLLRILHKHLMKTIQLLNIRHKFQPRLPINSKEIMLKTEKLME